ncbi:hypothetical protein Droror1_Dr00023739 [Drosera rotundifolia]
MPPFSPPQNTPKWLPRPSFGNNTSELPSQASTARPSGLGSPPFTADLLRSLLAYRTAGSVSNGNTGLSEEISLDQVPEGCLEHRLVHLLFLLLEVQGPRRKGLWVQHLCLQLGRFHRHPLYVHFQEVLIPVLQVLCGHLHHFNLLHLLLPKVALPQPVPLLVYSPGRHGQIR